MMRQAIIEAVHEQLAVRVKDANVEAIIARLSQLPIEIRRHKDAVAAANRAVEESQADVDRAEAVLVARIANDMNPQSGKPVFSNAEARQAELTQRRAKDEDYQIAFRALVDASEAKNTASFELEKLQDEFRSLGSVSRLVAAELSVLS